MGLFAKMAEKRMKDPIPGTAKVVSISMPDPTATSQNYSMQCVVSADGIPPTATGHKGMAKTSKWPSPGEELPITIDRTDPERFIIRWDDVQTGREQAAQLAQQMAMQMRAGQSGMQGAEAAQMQAAQAAQMQALGQLVPKVSAADIIATGRPGTATLLQWFEVPLPPKDAQHQVVGLVLNVSIDGIAPYQSRNAFNVPLDKVSRLIPGTTLPVKADQQNLLLVAVDWDAF